MYQHSILDIGEYLIRFSDFMCAAILFRFSLKKLLSIDGIFVYLLMVLKHEISCIDTPDLLISVIFRNTQSLSDNLPFKIIKIRNLK